MLINIDLRNLYASIIKEAVRNKGNSLMILILLMVLVLVILYLFNRNKKD